MLYRCYSALAHRDRNRAQPRGVPPCAQAGPDYTLSYLVITLPQPSSALVELEVEDGV